jgi:hypothetical protein
MRDDSKPTPDTKPKEDHASVRGEIHLENWYHVLRDLNWATHSSFQTMCLFGMIPLPSGDPSRNNKNVA